MKETFIIRTEWMDAILSLNVEDRGVILTNLFYYHSDKKDEIECPTIGTDLVWKLIEPNLKRNIVAYDKRSLTSSVNGSLGGRPPKKEGEENNLNNLNKPNEITYKPIESLSVSVIDSDSVLVSVNVNDYFEKSIKDELWVENVQRACKIETSKLTEYWITEFYHLQQAAPEKHINLNDWRSHAVRWIKIEISKANKLKPISSQLIKDFVKK